MSFKFVIPIKNSDLQTPDKNSYCVTRVSAPIEIPGLLKSKRYYKQFCCFFFFVFYETFFTDAKTDFRQNGPSYIIEHFDTFYSVIDANDCPIGTLIKAFDALYESVDKLARELAVELKKSPINEDVRQDLGNVTKMLVYLIVNTVKVIDTNINNSFNDGGKGNKKVDFS